MNDSDILLVALGFFVAAVWASAFFVCVVLIKRVKAARKEILNEIKKTKDEP